MKSVTAKTNQAIVQMKNSIAIIKLSYHQNTNVTVSFIDAEGWYKQVVQKNINPVHRFTKAVPKMEKGVVYSNSGLANNDKGQRHLLDSVLQKPKRALNMQLNKKKAHSIIKKTIYAVSPPKVGYEFTDFERNSLPSEGKDTHSSARTVGRLLNSESVSARNPHFAFPARS